MRNALLFLSCLLFLPSSPGAEPSSGETVTITADILRDKIRGGMLGQLLGNLNGLKHELKYIHAPGSVKGYIPALPEGARTDDDTDFEWVYIIAMQQHDTLFLSQEEITRLWKERINKRIWCSNYYARQLMDIGFTPPLTGAVVFNPWADFNISGQFICESFGLMAPAMPRTAARIGLNLTRVTIDGEPAQTTQLFTAMIATAFVSDDVDAIIDAGLEAVDPQCAIRMVVNDIRQWHARHPEDWRATRRLAKEKYSRFNGAMRDRNGYELNTAGTMAALLYGSGDFARTLETAFNFGWDCDNSAATAGTILGVIKGYKNLMSRGWAIVDRYRNTTRDNMPMDETITSFADRIVDLAEKVIMQNGGRRDREKGAIRYTIKKEAPANVRPMINPAEQTRRLKAKMSRSIKKMMLAPKNPEDAAYAAYCAICLDLAGALRRTHPEKWRAAVKALESFPNVTGALFNKSPTKNGDRLREKALQAGLRAP